MNINTQSILSLLSEHGPRLHAMILRITLREEVAEDLMQELFLKLNRCGSLGRAADPVGYAVRAAMRLAFDWRRSQQRRLDKVAIDEESLSDSNWKHCRLEQREDLKSLLDAIDRLSTVSRDIIVMRYLEDQSYEEIAQVVGNTTHQSRALCYKAILRLRKMVNSIGAGCREPYGGVDRE